MNERGYRALKKRLNRYHKFTFAMPRKGGKGFSPQQKSAITRQANKLLEYIKKVDKEKSSFIKKKRGVNMKKLPNLIVTNKGLFYPKPGAKIILNKIGKRREHSIEIRYKSIRERYFPFPLDLRGNMELIKDYVDYLVEEYKPVYIRWAIFGNAAGRYDPDAFGLYTVDLNKSNIIRKRQLTERESLEGISGVFLGYFIEGK